MKKYVLLPFFTIIMFINVIFGQKNQISIGTSWLPYDDISQNSLLLQYGRQIKFGTYLLKINTFGGANYFQKNGNQTTLMIDMARRFSFRQNKRLQTHFDLGIATYSEIIRVGPKQQYLKCGTGLTVEQEAIMRERWLNGYTSSYTMSGISTNFGFDFPVVKRFRIGFDFNSNVYYDFNYHDFSLIFMPSTLVTYRF